MSFERIETPKVRLYNLTLGFLKSFDMSVDQTAGSLVAAISDDPAALVELVGKDRLIGIAQEYAQRLYDEDIRGGGIGLRPADKTGGNAAADETGHNGNDLQMAVARSSAPPIQTPAEKLVGGGHSHRDDQKTCASPTFPANDKRSTVSEYVQPVRKLEPTNVAWSPANIGTTKKALPPLPTPQAKAPAPKPRISFAERLKAENRYAASILNTLVIRGRPIGDWTHEEMMSQVEKNTHESRILEAFGRRTPPGQKARDYIQPEEAEAIAKSVGAADAA